MKKATPGQKKKVIQLMDQAGWGSAEYQRFFDQWPAVRELVAVITAAVAVVTTLLRHIGIVTVPPTEAFVAKEQFIVDTSKKARVRISYTRVNLKAWFGKKTEEAAPEKHQLRYAELITGSFDAPILAELGATAETTLAAIFVLMDRQKYGKDGVLLTNGWANIFYVKDAEGALRAVNVYWGGGGWNVNTHEVSDPDRWRDGRRVFSRNPGA
jgi:hypothetical protein